MVEMLGLVERDCGNGPVWLRLLDQLQLEMASIRPDLAHIAVVIDILCQEDRSAVPRPERLELLEYPEKFRGDLREVQPRVYHNDRREHVLAYILFDEILYPFAELGQVLLLECQTCCIQMASEVLQQVCAALDSIIKVETVDAPCRPGDKAV